jgi:hypothetical protein
VPVELALPAATLFHEAELLPEGPSCSNRSWSLPRSQWRHFCLSLCYFLVAFSSYCCFSLLLFLQALGS